MFYVYILRSKKNQSFYIGQTNDFQNRIARHNAGYEKYTSAQVPWELVCLIMKGTRSEAVKLEMKLKNLSRKRLETFIKKYSQV